MTIETLQPPVLEHVCDLFVDIAPPIEVGQTLRGRRRIIPITGGRASGVCHDSSHRGNHMITEYVLFDLPPGISREDVIHGMREVSHKWRANAALIRKTFVYDPVANQAGAFYLWPDRTAAERAHDEAWRQSVRAKYGSDPVIRYFDTPIVVDNVLGKTIETDSPDTGTD